MSAVIFMAFYLIRYERLNEKQLKILNLKFYIQHSEHLDIFVSEDSVVVLVEKISVGWVIDTVEVAAKDFLSEQGSI